MKHLIICLLLLCSCGKQIANTDSPFIEEYPKYDKSYLEQQIMLKEMQTVILQEQQKAYVTKITIDSCVVFDNSGLLYTTWYYDTYFGHKNKTKIAVEIPYIEQSKEELIWQTNWHIARQTIELEYLNKIAFGK